MIKAILTLFLITFSIHFIAQQIEVCPSCKIKSIKEAVKKAKKGDKIIVRSGTYYETGIYIDKSISLTGIGNPIIDGKNKGEAITIVAEGVEISGFTITNIISSYTKDDAAIKVIRADNFSIHDNILKNVFFGITVQKSHHGTIKNNSISSNGTEEFNSGDGVHLWYSSDINVVNNKVSGMRDGIYLEFVTNSNVSFNYSGNNIRYGLHFMFSNSDKYTDNTFSNNGAGVAVMFSKKIKMFRNKFAKNWGSSSYGLLLKEIYDAEIEYNFFDQNTIGINVEGSSRIDYKNNDFINNGWAVKVSGACYDNKFKGNNFISNAFDISCPSKMNNNSFDQNYWSEYTGYDLDKNGIGDIPFRPVKLFSYIADQTPESIVLLRSLFIDIINFSEKVSPVFTPDNLMDNNPLMKKIK